jgi:ABC-type dipeptide/oligopeptide/nickel transport system permease subunit
MSQSDSIQPLSSKPDRLRHALELAAPVVQELAKTVLLLVLMLTSVWMLLEIFRGESWTGPWHERLGRTFAGAGLDKDGLPIAPKFFAAAAKSLAIVLTAAVLLGIASFGMGFLFAVHQAWSVLRLPLGLLSAVPAFMFPACAYILFGVPVEPGWFWPAVCLAVGDLNAVALTGHCYDGIRRELTEPYVRTARAQGLSVWSDMWPRAVLIALEGIRARVPHLLGGTVAIELAFNIHGIGQIARSAVLSTRPDYNVLIWIAGLGIIATRLLSLADRLARRFLTPERGRSTAWSHEGLGVGLIALWRGARGGANRLERQNSGIAWPTAVPEEAATRHPIRWSRWAQRLRAYWRLSPSNRAKALFASVTLLAGLVLVAVSAWGGGYTMLDTAELRLPSSWAHPLGTNENGEDVLSTIALGGRELLLPLLLAVLTAVMLGGLFGSISGLCFGAVLDIAMDAYAELWESVPKLILVLAAVTYISYESYSVKLYLIMGLAFAPLLYRAVRDEVGALRTSLFLESAVTLGVSRRRILWIHVIRNHAVPVLCVQGAVLVGYLLLFDAILGYCAVRQRSEVFTWGNLLGTGIDDLTSLRAAGIDANSWIVWGPFLAMLVAITSSAVIGDALKSLGRSIRFSQ